MLLLDFVNIIFLVVLLIFCAQRYHFMWWEILLLTLHLLVLIFIDKFIPVDYLPDQISYFYAANEWRESLRCTHPFITVCSVSALFAVFPVFIVSPKSIAVINFVIYLALWLFVRHVFIRSKYKLSASLLCLLYPSLIFYSSTGLRDMLVLLLMLISLYYFLIQERYMIGGLLLLPLLIIKRQNVVIFALAYCAYLLFKIRNKYMRTLLICVYVLLMIGIFVHYNSVLLEFRSRMYSESFHLNPDAFSLTLPLWSVKDLYYFFLAPFFWDAKNTLQMLQSLEDALGLAFAIYLLVLVAKALHNQWQTNFNYHKFIILLIILLVAALVYSYSVFNIGAMVRYRFPFLFCFYLYTLFLLSDRKETSDTLV